MKRNSPIHRRLAGLRLSGQPSRWGRWHGSGALLALALLLSGCRSRPDFYLPNTNQNKLPPRSGSIEELSRKSGARDKGKPEMPATPTIVLLVAHDETGKAVGIQLRRSCGDPALDLRAQQMVMDKWQFPKGKANVVAVSVDPKTLPKK